MKIEQGRQLIAAIKESVAAGFLGKPAIVEAAVFALAGGLHLLIEDISGVGKTTLVKCLAKAAGLDLGRIQFTPDLLPGDVVGAEIWDSRKQQFVLKKGAVFHQFILADELNRATARTQSALLEAMQEGQVTVEGRSLPLPQPFFVAATQNPITFAGTFNLPESQLDRFGISFAPGYPERQVEIEILQAFAQCSPLSLIKTVSDAKAISRLQQLVGTVYGRDSIYNYLLSLTAATRRQDCFRLGISARGSRHLLIAAKVNAVADGRDYLIPEDIKKMARFVFTHKLVLAPEAKSEGKIIADELEQLLAACPVPAGYRK